MLKQVGIKIFRQVVYQPRACMVSVINTSASYSTCCDGLSIENKDHVLWLKLDRPEKFNALTKEMFKTLGDTFNKVNQDDSVKAIVLTGTGDYYSSGNDLKNLTAALQHEGGPEAGLTKAKDLLMHFVDSLINLEKFLIAAINGPAIGIAVSTLPLCDYVLASDRATFQTPFTALGQCPEACSSYTFPLTMGSTRANELLLLNMSWDAQKAQSYGLVSSVIEHDKFDTHLNALLYGKKGLVATCYPNSLKVSKSLVRNFSQKEKLRDVNRKECDAILKLWLGEECADAVQKFFMKSK